ncbi:MAG: homocysteine S-methyltransferase family protein [Syntrophales bacterium]|nr:homocysteine S-methyltransferase family protein [Syntrophales bacterium]
MKTKRKVKKILKDAILVLDGAMGTELQKRGLPLGVSPEVWCLEHPEVLASIHRSYVEAGAQVIYTCTFGANRKKLAEYGFTEVRKLNATLASVARQVAGRDVIILGDMGPTGYFIEPMGEMSFEEAVNVFREQAEGLLAGGVDGFVVETMMDIQEARAALIALKELGDYFTMVTMTYEPDGRTLNGTDIMTALITLQSLRADAVGCNCSAGPEEMIPWIARMKPYATVPLVAKPNAGLPRIEEGHTFFDMEAEKFASFAPALVEAGVNIIGGCCGTTPEHIRSLTKAVMSLKPQPPWRKALGAVSSYRSYFIFEEHPTLAVVGERINPTGKKDLQEAIREGSFGLIRQMAKEQEDQGAELLDVNVGMPGVDEVTALKRAVLTLAGFTSLPLVLDSPNSEALEQALRVYPGRALVNSVSGEEKKISHLLPVVAKYGAMFILLPITDQGVPQKREERIAVIKNVYGEAKKRGFSKDDVVVDGLVLTVAAEPKAVCETLDTIAWCHKEFGVKTILGVSNVSFGLPERRWLNAALIAMARREGLDLAIVNPASPEVMAVQRAADVLLDRDRGAVNYLRHFSAHEGSEKKKKPRLLSPEEKVKECIIEGDRENIIPALSAVMDQGVNPQELVNNLMIPSIIEVGERYSRREFFLPQLLASAETMKKGLAYLEPFLVESGGQRSGKGTIIMATVHGDIHDIGKNIVALMLRNHGFNVVDLGKDVPTERIVEAIRQIKPQVVGLSALMTTTMVVMKDVINSAKKAGLSTHFLLGGAVVSPAYAHSLDAYYAKDGVEAVKVVKKLIRSDEDHE